MGRFTRRPARPNEAPLPDPLAFLLTWTTYGTWLSGDQRGWILRGRGIQLPNPLFEQRAASLLTEAPCILGEEQRALVEQTIRDHCSIRRWELLAVNCRSNHVHVVVAAPCHPEVVRDQLKAWCTRKLKALQHARGEPLRQKWWTERGSERYIGDDESLEAAVHYVLDGQ